MPIIRYITNFYSTFRRGRLYARLAEGQLLGKGRHDAGRSRCSTTVVRKNPVQPDPAQLPVDRFRSSRPYYMAGAFDKGNEVLEEYAKNLEEYIDLLPALHREIPKNSSSSTGREGQYAEYLLRPSSDSRAMFGQTGTSPSRLEQYLQSIKGIVERSINAERTTCRPPLAVPSTRTYAEAATGRE